MSAEPEATPRPRNGAYHPPALDPVDDPSRGNLATAVAKHVAAVGDLAQITDAQRRAPDVVDAASAVEAAQSALDAARADEGSFLVRQLMGEETGENPVSHATAALQEAEAALARARQIRGLLDERQLAAAARVRWEAAQVRDRVGSVLSAAPAVAALVEAFAAAQYRLAALRACLRAVNAANGIPAAHRLWDAREEPDGTADPQAAAWRTAIGCLATDPDAALPS
jgi:hypothetical protein